MKKQLLYGNYQYEYDLVYEERKTLSLTVHPDMSIVLKAPQKATPERIESFLRRKWMWLEKQLRFFGKYQKKRYKKEYLSGESFLYLGRQYRLKVQRSKTNKVLLKYGILHLYTTHKVSEGKHNKIILNNWYKEKTKTIFQKRYNIVLNNFEDTHKPQLVIREMKKRWGSFLNNKKIILNPRLVKAPTSCIDYVITHELCHIKYKNHTTKYFEHLSSKYPGWEKVKEKLELRLE